MKELLGEGKLQADEPVTYSGHVDGLIYKVGLRYDSDHGNFSVSVDLRYPVRVGFVLFNFRYRDIKTFEYIPGIEPYLSADVQEVYRESILEGTVHRDPGVGRPADVKRRRQ